MGANSGISWTDMTFNPWIGCTKVSEGCKLCYAETQNKRYRWNPYGWGPGRPRHRTSPLNWNKVAVWNAEAKTDGIKRRVFCSSLADVFDSEAPWEWRNDLWHLIGSTKHLEWLILTKRPENIKAMFPFDWLQKPPDHIRIGVTAENQENADKRIPELLCVWKGKNFISYEPALGPINFNQIEVPDSIDDRPLHFSAIQFANDDCLYSMDRQIDWIICGGESGAGCRPMNLAWARDVHLQCEIVNIPFFFKQIGGHPNKRHNPADWPEDLRIQEFPE